MDYKEAWLEANQDCQKKNMNEVQYITVQYSTFLN